MKLKVFAFSIVILLAIPGVGVTNTCNDLLDVPFELQVKSHLISNLEHRKSLEESVHKSNGTLSNNLELQLHQIFKLRDRYNRIPNRNQNQILRSIQTDPIVRRLSQPSQSKLIRLVFHGYARPYMALLIARYMEERENKQGHLSQGVMFKIEMIVLLYTIEWTVRSLLKNRLNELTTGEQQEIIDALKSPGRHRHSRGLNYNNPDGRVGFDSLFIGYLKEREAWLASTNFFSFGDSIFE